MPTNKTVFEEIYDEIKGGPFSILSEKALDRLYLLVNRAMTDGYDRGKQDGFAQGVGKRTSKRK